MLSFQQVFWQLIVFEFDGRSVNYDFLYFVGVLQALLDRYVPISSQIHVPVWMKDPPRWLAREKAVRWKEYKEVRRQFGRNHDLAAVALNSFNQVKHRYRNFVRNNQCIYEGYLVKRLASAPNLLHLYVRKRKGCPSVGPLKSRYECCVQCSWHD